MAIKKHIKSVLQFWPLYLMLSLYLAFSFFTFKDYGISKIEHDFYHRSTLLRDFWLGKYDFSNEEHAKDSILSKDYLAYGAFLSMINSTGSFESYHLLNMLFASLIFVFAYTVLFQKYKDKYLALIGPIFIFLCVRFTGHIPINPVDIPFAVMFFVSICLIYLSNHFADKFFNSIFFKGLLLGVAFGLTQSLNFVGFLLYFVYLTRIGHNLIFRFKKNKFKTKLNYLKYEILQILIIVFVASFIMIITWPYLGSNFISNFFELTQQFLFSSGKGVDVFYKGSFINSYLLPRSYFFNWFIFTTPAFVLVSFLLSLIFIFKKINDDLYATNVTAIALIIIFFLFVKHPIIEGMRQFLFIIPLVCLNAALVIVEILYETKTDLYKKLLLITLVISFANTMLTFYLLHPYQYLYFNESVEDLKKASHLFDLDYFQTTNKEVSSRIICDISKNNLADPYVYTCNDQKSFAYYGQGIFKLTDDTEKADYLVCPNCIYDLEPIHQIVREGVILNNIYKIHHEY